MDISSDLSARLQQERTRLGLTQVDLAARLGCSRSVVFSYEDGRSSPTFEWLSRFAAVGADLSYVVLGARASSSTDEEWLLSKYRDLPDMFRGTILLLTQQLWRNLQVNEPDGPNSVADGPGLIDQIRSGSES